MSDSRQKAKFTVKQHRALEGLLKGGSVVNAAKLANISERQIYRWFDKPEFQQALTDAGEQSISAAVRSLSDAALGAVLVHRTIAQSEHPKREDTVRVRAANAILTHTLRWKEMHEIEKRLSELERIQNAKP